MRKKYFLAVAFTSMLLAACESQIDDLETTRLTSNITVAESNGVVTGTISSTATADQIMVSSANSEIADSAVTFPPGALAVSTELALGKASDKSTSVLTELGVTDGLPATAPVYAGPVSGTPPVLGNALTIQLPLPLDELALADTGTSKLVLVYVIYVDNSWKAGMIPLTTENLEGTFVKQELPGLGYYQIVSLNSARGQKEVASAVRPELAK
ncbi:MAG TPA: hypothetical protein VFO10_21775 [Oligoflexus sp.]|uniref:hypothetical protein n=1 Tax=Oligoflexus sp. TaxID=1971216 RepID=UPI002D7EEB33|nr:hypothetical protein [Oligoflexus sp.]HET9239906.1 hypothetical protein [Oligoflexus sp.]